jgi:hypothetical protein
MRLPVDIDISGLSDSMASVLSLRVHGRIPVRVVEDDRVGAREIHADTTRPRTQNHAEDALVGVEPLHDCLSLLDGRRAVQTKVLEPVVVEEVLEYVQHSCHLCEDERSVLFGDQASKKAREDLQLAAVVLNETLLWELRRLVERDQVA